MTVDLRAEADQLGAELRTLSSDKFRDRVPSLVWERAFSALASLVREEYPERHTLARIAQLWGDLISPEQIEALCLVEACDALVNDAGEVVEIQTSAINR